MTQSNKATIAGCLTHPHKVAGHLIKKTSAHEDLLANRRYWLEAVVAALADDLPKSAVKPLKRFVAGFLASNLGSPL